MVEKDDFYRDMNKTMNDLSKEIETILLFDEDIDFCCTRLQLRSAT